MPHERGRDGLPPCKRQIRGMNYMQVAGMVLLGGGISTWWVWLLLVLLLALLVLWFFSLRRVGPHRAADDCQGLQALQDEQKDGYKAG